MTTSSRGSRQPTVLAPGMVFARDFTVVSQLASGGMGTVYVVEQSGTRRRRALKLMHPDLVNDERSRGRFEREATIASHIDSEHVVDVVAAGVDEATGVPWLVMELLEGTDLAARIISQGPMPRAEVLEAFRQLCHALDAAHRAGIVHRDLKPENVFLSRARRSDARFTVKVLDFGIAKWMQEARAATMASQSIGTPYWMAPEQTETHGRIGAATDLWPLGLMAFYLLTGKVYWATAHEKEPSLGAVLGEIVALPIERASTRAAQLGVGHLIPGGFDAWFARCVVRDPSQRFAGAGDALRGLEQVLAATEQPVARTIPMKDAPAAALDRARDGRTVAVAPAPSQPPRVLGAAPSSHPGAAQVTLAPMTERSSGRSRPVVLALLVLLLAACGIGALALTLRARTPASSAGAGSASSQLPAPPQLPPATPPGVVVPPPTGTTSPPVVPPPPPPVLPPTPPAPIVQRYSGSSAPDNLGCIPCDGQARFIGPGLPGVGLGLGIDNPASRSRSVPLAGGGVLGNLTVTASAADGGVWSYELWVNGTPAGVSCTLSGVQTTCSSGNGVTIRDGDRVTLGVGNPGAPFGPVAGQGRFQVAYTFTLTR